MPIIRVKRIYQPPEESDGYRVLVDRLWPRGISKLKAAVDVWQKDIAPSDEIRKKFGHITEKFPEFKKNYIDELCGNPQAAAFVNLCSEKLADCNVTLLYAAKDEKCNNANVLCEWINSKICDN
jgi:uncharacterized protein YeaO (DUF488 family)